SKWSMSDCAVLILPLRSLSLCIDEWKPSVKKKPTVFARRARQIASGFVLRQIVSDKSSWPRPTRKPKRFEGRATLKQRPSLPRRTAKTPSSSVFTRALRGTALHSPAKTTCLSSAPTRISSVSGKAFKVDNNRLRPEPEFCGKWYPAVAVSPQFGNG